MVAEATPLGLPRSEVVPTCGGRMNVEVGVGTPCSYDDPYKDRDGLLQIASFGADGGTSDPADKPWIRELQRALRERERLKALEKGGGELMA